MKRIKYIILFFCLTASPNIFAQDNDLFNLLIEAYTVFYDLKKPHIAEETDTEKVAQNVGEPDIQNFHSTVPDGFDEYFHTDFIDFASLREENVTEFSFNDSLTVPIKEEMIITSTYGMRGKRKHYGIDFRLKTGDPVHSIFSGKVRIAKFDPKYGNVVVIRHFNMSETVYAHLDKILVDINQFVKVGDIIGQGGNTGISSGTHLHFELRYKGYPINPIVKGKFMQEFDVTFKE